VPYQNSDTARARDLSQLEAELARIVSQTAETLSKSCLYFTPSNLAVLGSPSPEETQDRIRDTEQRVRVLLSAAGLTPAEEANLRQRLHALADLTIAFNAAVNAARLFALLDSANLTLSARTLLKRPVDAAVQMALATASALEATDARAARTAVLLNAEAQDRCREMIEMLDGFGHFMPPATFRMSRAALVAVSVTADSISRAAGSVAQPAQLS
jgi:hypothetical protein